MIHVLVEVERNIKSVMESRTNKKTVITFVIFLLILLAINSIPIFLNNKISKINDIIDNHRYTSQQLQTRYLSDQNTRNMILINKMAGVYLNIPLEGDFKKISENCEDDLKDNKSELDYLRKIQICYTKDIEKINNEQILIDKKISIESVNINNTLNWNNNVSIIIVIANILISVYISNKFEKVNFILRNYFTNKTKNAKK